MKSAATSEADWEKIMAQGTQNSWKDEYLVLLFSIPLILSFLPFEWAKQAVTDGFAALGHNAGLVQLYVGCNRSQ
jgi:hypothetical protein